MSQLDKELHLKPEVFQRMSNLRLLKFYNPDNGIKKQKVYLDQNLQSLPCSLRYLHWEGYPLRQLPSNFEPENLVELNMQYSQLEQLFNGVQNLENLKRIDLSNSTHLIQFPDFSHAPNLEKINFEHCTSLPQVPSHCLRNLNKLIDLNLSHCKMIQSLSDGVDYLTSLRTLTVQGCSNLNSFPAVINLGNLVSLNLGRTIIENLPSSIGSLNNLSSLKLYDCKRLLEVPSSIINLDFLKDLDLSGCSILEKFPELPRNIEKLNMKGTAIKEVASSSIECQFVLKDIFLDGCKSLVSLSTNIFKLKSLVTLTLNGCSNLKGLPDISEPMKSLQALHLRRTGIRQLPPSIGHLIGLKGLYMDECENLESVPNGICNLNALQTLDLSNCLKLECMPLLFGPTYLSSIYLGNCDLKEIPETIKALKLTCLHIHNCKNLKFLPELPLTLELLDARGCVSLETVSSTEKEFTQKFWDDYKTDTYEHWEGGYGRWDCFFNDCLQLDQSGRQTTNTEFQLRVMSLAARPVRPGDVIWKVQIWRSSVHACYPGNEIPIWFDHQFEGSSITIKLPQQWRDTKFLGFVACAVGDRTAHPKMTELSCNVKFICLNGENHESFWMFARPNDIVVPALPPAFNSDHVYMWYWPTGYSICVDAVEVTFRFAFEELGESREDVDIIKPSECEVKRCGIRMLYQKDLDIFFSNNE
ncbi:hypothetical protein TIFTF001_051385 [Ficus carica]|uniref:Uncharacterized protein n=1 Tax=Ficus carica TaxID=3494 RepID=A0AA87YWJ2_FICCA|nr:hypothetical protein TIFTF001_051385 [Ficus carica]